MTLLLDTCHVSETRLSVQMIHGCRCAPGRIVVPPSNAVYLSARLGVGDHEASIDLAGCHASRQSRRTLFVASRRQRLADRTRLPYDRTR